MKKSILILLFFTIQFTYSQNNSNTLISINYENSSRENVISQIENLTNYQFYFSKGWLDNKTISGDYKGISIKELLDIIFKETVINYYISPDNKIFLTQSVLIYDALPVAFFNNNEKIEEPNSHQPILSKIIQQNKTVHNKTQTYRIGKERKHSKKTKYTLSGTIKNSSNNAPIPNLVLMIKNQNINSITNEKGFYSIELPAGINYLETKSFGIKDSKKKVIIYENGTLNFQLEESSEMLQEVIVEAQRLRNIKEAITGVTQIKIKNIKNIPLVLGERDILKVATTMPGITKAGEGSSGYNVRGGKEDQNLILLDDGVLYNSSHLFGIFSALNPFTSGEIKIYKGSIPAEYGGRLSSVFDIKTKNSNTEKLKGEASIGPVTSNLSLEIPIVKGKSGLIIGGRGTYSDWILKSLDEESLNKSKASFYDFVAKYSHVINKNNQVEASGYYSKDEFSITSDSLYSYSNKLLSLKWNHKFNKKSFADVSLTNSEYKFNINFDGESINNFDLNYKINETDLNLRMKYLINKKHKLKYGISLKSYTINPGSKNPIGSESTIKAINIPEEKAIESGIFISDNFKVNKKLLLNLGVRYSFYSPIGESNQKIYTKGVPKSEETLLETKHYNKNELIKTFGGPEIRTSARYFLTSELSLKASYNKNYQYIHTLSNNTTVSPTDTWKLSDLNIEPQQANQFSLGLYKNIDGNAYELSIEGYYKKSNNILDYKIGADLLLNESIETEVLQGKGKAYGIEFLVKKTHGKLNGWLGYTYSRSFNKFKSNLGDEQINNGKYFPSNFDKPHDVSLVANYKLTKRFSFSSNFAYQTGRPVTYPTGKYIYNGAEYVMYSHRNKFRIPDYYRLDLGFNVEGNHRIKKFAHSFWNISIYNVLGRNNPYSVFFVTEKGEVKAYQSSIFSIPIPTITYNFKF